MKKEFITVTPDSGSGNRTVTVTAEKNTGNARSSSITISGGGMTRTIKVNQELGAVNKIQLLSSKAIFEQITQNEDYIEVYQNSRTNLLTVNKDGANLTYQDPTGAEDYYQGEYSWGGKVEMDELANRMGWNTADDIPYCAYRVRLRFYKGAAMSFLFTIKNENGIEYMITFGSGINEIIFKVAELNNEIFSKNLTYESDYLDTVLYVIATNSKNTSDGTVKLSPGLNFVMTSPNGNILFSCEAQKQTSNKLITPKVMADNKGEYQCLYYPISGLTAEIPIAIVQDSANEMYFTNNNPFA